MVTVEIKNSCFFRKSEHKGNKKTGSTVEPVQVLFDVFCANNIFIFWVNCNVDFHGG